MRSRIDYTRRQTVRVGHCSGEIAKVRIGSAGPSCRWRSSGRLSARRGHCFAGGKVGANMTTRTKQALRSLAAGDIFHAHFTQWPQSKGPSLICLVTSVTEDEIVARTVSTQVCFTFDRNTGRSRSWEPPIYVSKTGETLVAVIDSIAPLPFNVHNALISLDRHFRLGQFSSKPDKSHLTAEHKEALLFVATHFPENPL